MNIWNQLPILRILIPFVAGILTSLLFDVYLSVPFEIFIFFGLVICIIIAYYKKIIRYYSKRWVLGLLVNVWMFLFGYELTYRENIDNRISDFSHYRTTEDTVIVTVAEQINERNNSYKVILEFNAIKKNGRWYTVDGKAITYFTKDSLSEKLQYGDMLFVCAGFSDVKAPQNPGEFNYKRYLHLKSVYSQGFIKSGKWILLVHNKGNILKATALKLRDKFLNIFIENNITGDEYAVAGALILGYTDKIDADLVNIYQGTGALHILSVSGMHVGVIFLVLNFLFAFLDRLKKGKYIKSVLLIILIWFYAAITGFSPAVNRAASMITFVIVGKTFGRNTNIYNTLSASALLLLIIDPMLIADVGFQLSYCAVLGIVMLQKHISNLWLPDNWFMKQVWAITTVSVAAQLATFPLALLYFHQFPNYFLLTNIVVIPLSNLIIYCGMLVLLASPFSLLVQWFAKMLVYLIYGLNESIRFIESLPYSVMKGLHISSFETILVYICIIFFIYYFISKQRRFLKLTFVIAIVFSLSVSVKKVYAAKQKSIIIYNIKRISAFDFIDGRNHILITDSLLLKQPELIATHMQNNWYNHYLDTPLYIKIPINKQTKNIYIYRDTYFNKNFIQFFDKRIALIGKNNFKNISCFPISIDYLIISENIEIEIMDLLKSYKPKQIIIDSSNSLKNTEKWFQECKKLNIPCFAVQKNGAWINSLE